MNTGFETLDYIVFAAYCFLIIGMGLWVSRGKKGVEKTASDYFLASRSLTWWAIGASLIASNISAEHFIAMSGSGYAIGLAIAAYEWIAAAALIIVGKYFLPVFLEKKIYTMPQFLEQRFNKSVSSIFAIFWLLMYVFINLTSVTYLGALALKSIMGVPLIYGIIGLALFSGVYSLYGGLKAVAWTDVIQVVFLVGGGLVTTYLALDAVSGGEGFFAGLREVFDRAPEKFQMILREGELVIPDNSGGQKDAYMDLPGLGVLFGAMWLTNFAYWGFNQYIIQRGLAAKDMKSAKRGLVFAGYLKILIPLLVVIPGITAYVLQDMPGDYVGVISKSDEAYPWLLANFVPTGIKGLAFAALAAAIVSSLSSMVNSTSTIFTMDIYKTHINPKASDKQLVMVGRIVAFVALVIAVLVAPQLETLDQAFQYIQEYSGFIYPGVFVIFFLGLFWKQITAKAALWTAIITLPLGAAFKLGFPDMPFIMRMGYIFIILCLLAVTVSLLEKRGKVEGEEVDEAAKQKSKKWGYTFIGIGGLLTISTFFYVFDHLDLGVEAIYMLCTLLLLLGVVLVTNVTLPKVDKKALRINTKLFETGPGFNVAAMGIIAILFLLYFFFW